MSNLEYQTRVPSGEPTFEEAHVELANLLRLPDFPSTVPVILLANKQDLPEARSDVEVRQSVAQGIGKRPTHLLPCCAVTGDGLDQLFSEMHQLILLARCVISFF
ncbi:unnamed protein product [Toxocara canis]|uniref:Ras family protein n=1 Tax=Toxocara canis TaxID=6265 RepID=A0A183UXD9_TOXCA|nr:unnamed protein product [Toxocara canis]